MLDRVFSKFCSKNSNIGLYMLSYLNWFDDIDKIKIK